MKILPFANSIKNDVVSSSVRLKRASVYGYSIADRTALIYRQNNIQRLYNITRSVSSKIIQGTSQKDLPYIAGAIGLLIPIPLMSPILMGIGYLARLYVSGAGHFYEHQNKANTNLPIK